MPAVLEQPPQRRKTLSSDIPQVWERLWRRAPSDARDDQLLLRERRSPRFDRVLAFLEATFGDVRGLRTIELGSGRGDLSALLAQRGAQVTLLDASRMGLAQAGRRFDRLKLFAEFVHGDLLELPDRLRGRFDVALSSGVIEHFRGGSRERALRGHGDAVRSGGAVVVSVPNAACIPYRLWKLYLELRGCWPYGMEIPYSAAELSRRAEQAGLSVQEVLGLGFWQSVGDHWLRGVCGRQVDWVDRRSSADASLGMSLLLLAHKPAKVRPTLRKSASGPRTVVHNETVERHFVRRGKGCEFDMEVAWVRAHLPRDSRPVADLGCGGGGLFEACGRRRVIGVDYEPAGLQHTRRTAGNVPLVCGSAERLPFADRSLGAITLQHVIEHLPSMEVAAAEWRRTLAPGGRLLVLTPNAEFVDPSIFDDPTHLRLLAAGDLVALLTGVGFEILDLRTLGLPWFRAYSGVPGGWRLRRWVTGRAAALSHAPVLRWSGQTLCCAARRARP